MHGTHGSGGFRRRSFDKLPKQLQCRCTHSDEQHLSKLEVPTTSLPPLPKSPGSTFASLRSTAAVAIHSVNIACETKVDVGWQLDTRFGGMYRCSGRCQRFNTTSTSSMAVAASPGHSSAALLHLVVNAAIRQRHIRYTCRHTRSNGSSGLMKFMRLNHMHTRSCMYMCFFSVCVCSVMQCNAIQCLLVCVCVVCLFVCVFDWLVGWLIDCLIDCLFDCIHIKMCVCVEYRYIYIYICTYIYIYICTYAYTNTNTNAYTYAYTCTHTHTN